MARKDLAASWVRTKDHLDAARRELRRRRPEDLAWYDECADHNELGLAFDALVQVGSAGPANRMFWQHLMSAAAEMALMPEDSAHGEALRAVMRHLSSPFDDLVGGELDTVSFVRDFVELRIDYSIVRLLTSPSGLLAGMAWQLTDATGADSLRRFIGLVVVSADFDEDDHIRLSFGEDAYIEASLRSEDRSGPEALHLMPADDKGQVSTTNMWIW